MEVFQFRRNLTASQAFQFLFRDPALGTESAHSSSKQINELAIPLQEYEQQVTILDLFLLIHGRWSPVLYAAERNVQPLVNISPVLYVFIHSHITLLSTCAQKPTDVTGVQQIRESHRGSVIDEPIISRIRTALTNWRTLWVRSYHALSEEKRARAGMYNNGDSFWLVTQLLIQNPAAAEIMGALEVNCEDALARLGSLLQETNQ
jgi:hypothetical protein